MPGLMALNACQQCEMSSHVHVAWQAILARQRAETLSSVLYPDDRTYQGKELRLKQQHFFVSATMQALACLPSAITAFACGI